MKRKNIFEKAEEAKAKLDAKIARVDEFETLLKKIDATAATDAASPAASRTTVASVAITSRVMASLPILSSAPISLADFSRRLAELDANECATYYAAHAWRFGLESRSAKTAAGGGENGPETPTSLAAFIDKHRELSLAGKADEAATFYNKFAPLFDL